MPRFPIGDLAGDVKGYSGPRDGGNSENSEVCLVARHANLAFARNERLGMLRVGGGGVPNQAKIANCKVVNLKRLGVVTRKKKGPHLRHRHL